MTRLESRLVTYNNSTCSCATSRQCSSPAALFYSNSIILHIIDGLRFGCTILESLLLSSLECFYSSTCLQGLLDAMPLGGPWYDWQYDVPSDYFLPINHSTSNFAINDTIETIVNRMFIDSWNINISYELFFESCASRQCSLTYNYRFDPLYVLTTFLSIFVSLSLALHFLVPWLVTFMNKILNRCRVAPH
ncbi:unnamed protein product [Rotaria sordida]|uniref:Uncharacterized protein n=1 Tax=Rotaria sordida TaxID=392033 RepID=A0A819TR76_9BILA|nr:unnamed protein product [Rotaria sordida]CAF4091692.1 unnamed protein product [Rotaria sordida]